MLARTPRGFLVTKVSHPDRTLAGIRSFWLSGDAETSKLVHRSDDACRFFSHVLGPLVGLVSLAPCCSTAPHRGFTSFVAEGARSADTPRGDDSGSACRDDYGSPCDTAIVAPFSE